MALGKKCLHIGAGIDGRLPSEFWYYDDIRLDINPETNPTVVGSMIDLSMFPDNEFDAVYGYHVLEHIYDWEVKPTIAGFHRVLKPNGIIFMGVPNLWFNSTIFSSGDLENVLFTTPKGSVTILDLLYGYNSEVRETLYMAHHTAFSELRLKNLLKDGFHDIQTWISEDRFTLYVSGEKKE